MQILITAGLETRERPHSIIFQATSNLEHEIVFKMPLLRTLINNVLINKNKKVDRYAFHTEKLSVYLSLELY